MPGVASADHPHHTVAANDFAAITHATNATADLHDYGFYLVVERRTTLIDEPSSVREEILDYLRRQTSFPAADVSCTTEVSTVSDLL